MLLVAGCVSFLNYLGVLHLRNVWQYAPLLMVGFGVANMVFFYSQPRLFARGAMMSFMGLWLFAVFQGFAGLTFQNSWPLVLIAFGVRIILESSLTLLASKKNLEKNL